MPIVDVHWILNRLVAEPVRCPIRHAAFYSAARHPNGVALVIVVAPSAALRVYLSHEPCLTEVRHSGCYGANREVDFSARIQTLRTDNFSRTIQKLSYTFTRDVSARRISLFKLGRTFSYQTPKISWGDLDGLLEERRAPKTLRTLATG